MKIERVPGTASFYTRKIYPDLGVQTLPIAAESGPTSALSWFVELGLVHPDAQLDVLEIGCGAGRNLKAVGRLFPNASLFGFDGAPLALSMAKNAAPQAYLQPGDIHSEWPFAQQFDLILDITVGIPESETPQHLDRYVQSFFQGLRPGGFGIVEAIAPEDESSRSFPGDDQLVMWDVDGEQKPERLMSLDEAKTFYEKYGFKVIASRPESFLGSAFGKTDLRREFFQLIIQK